MFLLGDSLDRSKLFSTLEANINESAFGDLPWSTPVILQPSDLSSVSRSNTVQRKEIEFVEGDIVDIISKTSDAAVLVFCSLKKPNGYMDGHSPQEDAIGLRSSWVFQVKPVEGFYTDVHGHINTDNLLYSENSYILLDRDGNEMNPPVKVSFIGATAPNLRGMINDGHSDPHRDVYNIMSYRIENVLKAAQKNGKKELVLGAWGCGVFGLDPIKVSLLFKNKINEGWFSGKITFAFPSSGVLNAFKSNLLN